MPTLTEITDIVQMRQPLATDVRLLADAAGRIFRASNTHPNSVNVRDYGATGLGSPRDDIAFAAAFAAASAAGITRIYVPAGTYRITQTLTLTDGMQLTGDGPSTLVYVNKGGVGIDITGTACELSDMTLDYETGGSVSTILASINAGEEANVYNVRFQNSPGSGLEVKNQFVQAGNIALRCHFQNNALGLDLSSSTGEYMTVLGCTITYNTVGCDLTGGNSKLVACNIDRNGTGIKIRGGGNHAHGVVVGCTCNHNTGLAVDIDSVTLGHRFVGTMFNDAAFQIVDSERILFDSCDCGGTTEPVITGSGTTDPIVFFNPSRFWAETGWTTTGSVIRVIRTDQGVLRIFDPASASSTVSVPANLTGTTYADNAAAIAAGLDHGTLFRLTAGGLDVVIDP